jgi:hypothetical protein
VKPISRIWLSRKEALDAKGKVAGLSTRGSTDNQYTFRRKSSQYLQGHEATMGNEVGLQTRFVFHKLTLLALARIRLPVTRLDSISESPWKRLEAEASELFVDNVPLQRGDERRS